MPHRRREKKVPDTFFCSELAIGSGGFAMQERVDSYAQKIPKDFRQEIQRRQGGIDFEGVANQLAWIAMLNSPFYELGKKHANGLTDLMVTLRELPPPIGKDSPWDILGRYHYLELSAQESLERVARIAFARVAELWKQLDGYPRLCATILEVKSYFATYDDIRASSRLLDWASEVSMTGMSSQSWFKMQFTPDSKRISKAISAIPQDVVRDFLLELVESCVYQYDAAELALWSENVAVVLTNLRLEILKLTRSRSLTRLMSEAELKHNHGIVMRIYRDYSVATDYNARMVAENKQTEDESWLHRDLLMMGINCLLGCYSSSTLSLSQCISTYLDFQAGLWMNYQIGAISRILRDDKPA